MTIGNTENGNGELRMRFRQDGCSLAQMGLSTARRLTINCPANPGSIVMVVQRALARVERVRRGRLGRHLRRARYAVPSDSVDGDDDEEEALPSPPATLGEVVTVRSVVSSHVDVNVGVKLEADDVTSLADGAGVVLAGTDSVSSHDVELAISGAEAETVLFEVCVDPMSDPGVLMSDPGVVEMEVYPGGVLVVTAGPDVVTPVPEMTGQDARFPSLTRRGKPQFHHYRSARGYWSSTADMVRCYSEDRGQCRYLPIPSSGAQRSPPSRTLDPR
ncbi:hypothetical protein NEMBOFW57_001593 [Staphylotrichum longicolle]|uniref:Uncharacterized protein n=1 Tax=Staphylotrichum longicolle TaxID=669026 RepID=A0AAD4HXZ9_9PEZI|nr:hypothetical protein NEMBOFW57_001593 [Staphylotrichum longicolle]